MGAPARPPRAVRIKTTGCEFTKRRALCLLAPARVALEAGPSGTTMEHMQKHGYWIQGGGRVIEATKTQIADERADVEVVIPVDATTKVDWAVPVAQIKALFIVCDKPVTLKTNDPVSPGDTIALAAGAPYEWMAGDPAPLVWTKDVASLFAAVPEGGEEAHLQIRCLLATSGGGHGDSPGSSLP